MGVTTAVAAVVSAVAAAGAGAYGVDQGEQQKRQQKRNLANQQKAQEEALVQSAGEAQRAQEEIAQQQKQGPDVARILAAEMLNPPRGQRLSGPSGITGEIPIGRKNLLGE